MYPYGAVGIKRRGLRAEDWPLIARVALAGRNQPTFKPSSLTRTGALQAPPTTQKIERSALTTCAPSSGVLWWYMQCGNSQQGRCYDNARIA